MCEAWERQPGESDAAWTAFVAYRDMGSGRSLAKVGQELGYADASLLERWSSRNGWRARVVAWEVEQDQTRRRAQLEELEEMARRQARQALELQTTLMTPVGALARKIEAGSLDLAGLPDANLLALAFRAARALPPLMRAERMARGEPTEIVVPNASVDVEAMRKEQLEFARRIRENPKAREALYDLLEQLDEHGAASDGDGGGDTGKAGVGEDSPARADAALRDGTERSGRDQLA